MHITISKMIKHIHKINIKYIIYNFVMTFLPFTDKMSLSRIVIKSRNHGGFISTDMPEININVPSQ